MCNSRATAVLNLIKDHLGDGGHGDERLLEGSLFSILCLMKLIGGVELITVMYFINTIFCVKKSAVVCVSFDEKLS